MSWQGKTVLVLGLGESGLAMAQWLHRQGARVRVADSRSEPPFAAELQRSAPGAALLTGPFNEALIDGVDLVGLSPGLSRSEPVVAEAGGSPSIRSRSARASRASPGTAEIRSGREGNGQRSNGSVVRLV